MAPDPLGSAHSPHGPAVGGSDDHRVAYRTADLEDCDSCEGKTFPGHACDGL